MALNRRNPCAEEIAPIVTLLKEFPHLTVNIGSLSWPNIAIQEYLLAAVRKQHGAMGTHPIRIELVNYILTKLYGSKQLPSGPCPLRTLPSANSNNATTNVCPSGGRMRKTTPVGSR
jgi:hypothetical protein